MSYLPSLELLHSIFVQVPPAITQFPAFCFQTKMEVSPVALVGKLRDEANARVRKGGCGDQRCDTPSRPRSTGRALSLAGHVTFLRDLLLSGAMCASLTVEQDLLGVFLQWGSVSSTRHRFASAVLTKALIQLTDRGRPDLANSWSTRAPN